MAATRHGWFLRFLSPEGRTVNGLVLVGGLGLLAWAVRWVAFGTPSAGPLGSLIVALCVLLYAASGRFSVGFLHGVLVASVVVVLLGLVVVGRDETARTRNEEGRAAASALKARLAVADPRPAASAPATPSPNDAAMKALDELDVSAASPTADAAAVAEVRPLTQELRDLLSRPANSRVLADLDRRIGLLTGNPLVNRLKQLSQAVGAALATPARPSSEAAMHAVMELCHAADGLFVPSTPPDLCTENTKRTGDPVGVVDRRVKAELEVARYRLAVAPTDDGRKAIQTEVGAKETEYAKAVGMRSKGPEDLDAFESIRAGAGAVLSELPGFDSGAGRQGIPLAFGVIGWVILAALAVWLYKRLVRRATAAALGPVTVDGDTADIERFRTYLLRNIPDPGAVPGASALLPVTDLLAATQNPAAGVIGKALAALIAATSQKRGYSVCFKPVGVAATQAKEGEKPPAVSPATTATPSTATGTKSPTDAPKGKNITVRVNDARTGRLVDQRLVVDKPQEDSVLKAAYWAAAVVLDRSDRLPAWARWSASTSESLAAFYSEEDLGDRDMKQIREAISRATTSGVLCLQLANECSLRRQHLDAFELTLRASALYGRFAVARYRLAVCASLLASDIKANWWDCPDADRERVLAALGRYGRSSTKDLCVALRSAGDDAHKAVAALCTFALEELGHVANLLDLWTLLYNALRRSERSYWLAFLRLDREKLNGRTHFRRAIDSARPAIRRRGSHGPVGPGDATDWEKDKRTFWQVSYNLACYDAIRFGQGEQGAELEAMGRLERAVERPNSHQLRASWVENDPDLDSIRPLARFTEFQKRLHDDERREDAASA